MFFVKLNAAIIETGEVLKKYILPKSNFIKGSNYRKKKQCHF